MTTPPASVAAARRRSTPARRSTPGGGRQGLDDLHVLEDAVVGVGDDDRVGRSPRRASRSAGRPSGRRDAGALHPAGGDVDGRFHVPDADVGQGARRCSLTRTTSTAAATAVFVTAGLRRGVAADGPRVLADHDLGHAGDHDLEAVVGQEHLGGELTEDLALAVEHPGDGRLGALGQRPVVDGALGAVGGGPQRPFAENLDGELERGTGEERHRGDRLAGLTLQPEAAGVAAGHDAGGRGGLGDLPAGRAGDGGDAARRAPRGRGRSRARRPGPCRARSRRRPRAWAWLRSSSAVRTPGIPSGPMAFSMRPVDGGAAACDSCPISGIGSEPDAEFEGGAPAEAGVGGEWAVVQCLLHWFPAIIGILNKECVLQAAMLLVMLLQKGDEIKQVGDIESTVTKTLHPLQIPLLMIDDKIMWTIVHQCHQLPGFVDDRRSVAPCKTGCKKPGDLPVLLL